jgi:hypothetical protein
MLPKPNSFIAFFVMRMMMRVIVALSLAWTLGASPAGKKEVQHRGFVLEHTRW